MAIRIRLTVDIDWIGDGAGTALLGQNQSNNPGYAAALGVGAAGSAQTLEFMVAELVPGGDTPTLANFLTAFQNAANDIAGTPPAGGSPLMSQAGAAFGSTQTPFQIVSGWATGNP